MGGVALNFRKSPLMFTANSKGIVSLVVRLKPPDIINLDQLTNLLNQSMVFFKRTKNIFKYLFGQN